MSIGGRSKVATSTLRRRNPGSAAAAVGAAYLETFTKTNGALAGQADLTWLEAVGFEVTIASNRAHPTGSIAIARAEVDAVTTDQYVQCDWISGTTSSNEILLIGRAGDSAGLNAGDHGVYLIVSTDSVDTIVEIQGWNPSGSISSDTLSGQQQVATWRLELDGTEARGYRNGVLVTSGTISLSPNPAGLRGGFEIDGSATVIDNFGFGDL